MTEKEMHERIKLTKKRLEIECNSIAKIFKDHFGSDRLFAMFKKYVIENPLAFVSGSFLPNIVMTGVHDYKKSDIDIFCPINPEDQSNIDALLDHFRATFKEDFVNIQAFDVRDGYKSPLKDQWIEKERISVKFNFTGMRPMTVNILLVKLNVRVVKKEEYENLAKAVIGSFDFDVVQWAYINQLDDLILFDECYQALLNKSFSLSKKASVYFDCVYQDIQQDIHKQDQDDWLTIINERIKKYQDKGFQYKGTSASGK